MEMVDRKKKVLYISRVGIVYFKMQNPFLVYTIIFLIIHLLLSVLFLLGFRKRIKDQTAKMAIWVFLIAFSPSIYPVTARDQIPTNCDLNPYLGANATISELSVMPLCWNIALTTLLKNQRFSLESIGKYSQRVKISKLARRFQIYSIVWCVTLLSFPLILRFFSKYATGVSSIVLAIAFLLYVFFVVFLKTPPFHTIAYLLLIFFTLSVLQKYGLQNIYITVATILLFFVFHPNFNISSCVYCVNPWGLGEGRFGAKFPYFDLNGSNLLSLINGSAFSTCHNVQLDLSILTMMKNNTYSVLAYSIYINFLLLFQSISVLIMSCFSVANNSKGI